MIIAFHGTTKKAAKKILQSGFKQGTYFTNHYETAMTMGGPWIFGVLFDKEFDYWERVIDNPIDPSKIIFLQKVSVRNKYYNPILSDVIQNQYKNKPCPKCNGYSELTYKNDGHHLLPGGSSFKKKRKIITCDLCKGYGEIINFQ